MTEMTNLSPKRAYQFLQETPQSILIDVRSSMEYLFVGHPVGALHVAWIDEPDWEVNPEFAQIIEKTVAGKLKQLNDVKQQAHVVLICRSGQRTKEAGAKLLNAGFTQVYHVDEGFEGDRDSNNHRGALGGWRFHGLPWEQC